MPNGDPAGPSGILPSCAILREMSSTPADADGRRTARVLLDAAAVRQSLSLPLDEVGDWRRLLDAAEFHGLAPLIREKSGATVERLPPEVVARLSRAYIGSAKRDLVMAASVSDCMSSLAGAGVPVIVLKGLPLASSLYSDPALRPCFDLDLLIHPADLAIALEVLARRGYTPAPHMARHPASTLVQLDCEVVLRHPRRMPIELHWAISPDDYPFRIDPELMWRSQTVIEVGGVRVPVLGRECQLVYLAVHGAKHAWARLLWLGDIVRAIDNGIDWNEALRLAAESGCTRPFLLGLLLSHGLLGTVVPGAILEQARADAAVVMAAGEAGARFLRIPPAEPSSIEQTAFNARLAYGAWAKARHWAAMVLTPKDEDFSRWRLPERLFWLYRPLRLQRVLVKHGCRILRSRVS
jgi:hypothetical protein